MKSIVLIALILLTTACAKKSDDPAAAPIVGESFHDIPLHLNTTAYRIIRFNTESEIAFYYYFPETSQWFGTYNVDYATVTSRNGADFTVSFYGSDCRANGDLLSFSVVSKTSQSLVFTTNETHPIRTTSSTTSTPIPQMPTLNVQTFAHAGACRL